MRLLLALLALLAPGRSATDGGEQPPAVVVTAEENRGFYIRKGTKATALPGCT